MDIKSLLEKFEDLAKEGWSKPMSLGKLGVTPTHYKSILVLHLNPNLQYRTIVMKYYPKSLLIRKWIEEYDGSPHDSECRHNKVYSDAIKEAIRRTNRSERATPIHTKTIFKNDPRGLGAGIRQKDSARRIKGNSIYGTGKEEQRLPSLVSGIRKV